MPLPRKKHNPIACAQCGYVRGATMGYEPLTGPERALLMTLGYELSETVHGDEIASRLGHKSFSCARGVLHSVMCQIPTRFDRV